MKPQIFSKFEKINRKWTFKILFTVFECEKAGFNYIKKALSPITSKILSSRLKALEETALLKKEVVVEKPLKVEYRLTRKGRRLMAAMATSLS